MTQEVWAIPQIRQVYYLTYAQIAALTGTKSGDLAYSTDRFVLYRWSGAAWQAITRSSGSGLFAARPAAADLPNGSIYYSTDTKVLDQVQAGAWVSINDPQLTYTELDGTDTITPAADTTWEDWDLTGIVAAGSIVEIRVKGGGNTISVGIRKNGSALARIIGCPNSGQISFVTGIDAGDILEVYENASPAVPQAGFHIMGYWS